ncbi:MAG: 1,4-beta-xylanase, partial [Clostridiales bacterium]|nr:1,4-beta-xylanase [Clostridiales bacterium]
MKKLLSLPLFYIFCLSYLAGQNLSLPDRHSRVGTSAETDQVMSSAYWDLWNPEVQARIDRDIEKYRKADALLEIEGLAAGTEVKIEQISHDFIFGAHIFNFNQLGTVERNKRYKELYGSLFNSATIAFYWRPFEMQPDRLRFREEYWDTEEYWNQVEEPEKKPHWRRPATDPVVKFCESKGIRLHGHPITWSAPRFHPEWLFEQFCPENEKEKINQLEHKGLRDLTNAQIEELIPVYTKEINKLFRKRIVDLAGYYKDRIHSWDVVNESRSDFNFHKTSLTGDGICLAQRGQINLMPGDYTYHSFKLADNVFPNNVLLNINDNVVQDTNAYNAYINQVKDLILHECRIDIMGSQMHLFNPQQCLDIANGKAIETPEIVWNKMATLS